MPRYVSARVDGRDKGRYRHSVDAVPSPPSGTEVAEQECILGVMRLMSKDGREKDVR